MFVIFRDRDVDLGFLSEEEMIDTGERLNASTAPSIRLT